MAMSSMAPPEVGVERGELPAPEAFVGVDPARDVAERRRVQPVEDLPPFALAADQPCLLQDLQVLRDRRQRDVEVLRQLRDRLVSSGQSVEDLAACRIGDGAEYGVHDSRILKDSLNCQDVAI